MVVTKEQILTRFVKQSETYSLIQYLRDMERRVSLSFLSDDLRVLDVASEINVTKQISSTVERLDFSKESSNLSKELLSGHVSKFHITSLKNPSLNQIADKFDAAVSIGPFDWKFLNIEHLMEEVYTVLEEGGLFIYSLPTIFSPYYVQSRLLRYYTLQQAFELLKNGKWSLYDLFLIYQPSNIWYRLCSHIPNIFQIPLIKFCEHKSRIYSKKRYKYLSRAGYLVFVLRKE